MWWCCCRCASPGRRVQDTSGSSDTAASSSGPIAPRHLRNPRLGSVNKRRTTKKSLLVSRRVFCFKRWKQNKRADVPRGCVTQLAGRRMDAPVVWDLHCSFIRPDLRRANSNQLLNYEPSRPCLHYGGGPPDWLWECLSVAPPGTHWPDYALVYRRVINHDKGLKNPLLMYVGLYFILMLCTGYYR